MHKLKNKAQKTDVERGSSLVNVNHPVPAGHNRSRALFDRVVDILEQARCSVVRFVNSNMVIAYWLIGREIIQEIQKGRNRAEYGEKVIEDLSAKLTQRYGKGFSITNLRYFRTRVQ